LLDNEFESLSPLLPSIVANTTAAREHVAEIERRIRTIKERGRGIKNTLPFKKVPKLVLIELINFVVMWLNAFPSKSGISARYSPRELILRRKLTFDKHCRVPFGTYCEVDDDPIPSNDTRSRTTPAIALGPTGNAQGTYKFFSLVTGKKIKRRTWTRLPMPDSIISKVHRFAGRDGNLGNLAFANRHGDLFAWNDEVDNEMDEQLVTEEPSPFPEIPAEFPGVELESDILATNDAVIDEAEIPGVAERIAAENAGLLDEDPAPEHPIIIADDGEIAGVAGEDDDDDIVAIGEIAPGPPPANNVVHIDDSSDDDGSFASAAQEWPDNNNDDDNDDAAAPQQDPTSNDPDSDDEEDIEQILPRRSGRSNLGQHRPQPYDEYIFFRVPNKSATQSQSTRTSETTGC
jgi:hypothetical protein